MFQKTILLLFWLSVSLTAFAQEEGQASYYNDAYNGKETASGERYDKGALTAAHKNLPFGTRVKVTHVGSGKSVVVRINDRGAFTKGFVIDLSRKAAEQLGIIAEGRAKVRLEVLGNDGEPVVDADGNKPAKPAKPEKPAKDPAKPAAGNEPVGMSPGGLFKISVLRVEKKDWGVQVATFSTYEAMMTYVSGLQDKWFKNVLVLMSGTEDAPQYKVVLGPFPDEATAMSYQQNVKKKHNLDGFVVDLKTAK
jgi:rare lipoprotein A